MRTLLLVSHRDLVETKARFEGAFFRRLSEHFDIHFADWAEANGSTSVSTYARILGRDLDSFDVCVLHVRFGIRRLADPLQWDGYEGLRVWLETDAWESYHRASPEYGLYPQVFQRDAFDVMISTGREVTERLVDDGVDARWMPKGYDEETLFPMEGDRCGVCTFGTAWTSRRALLNHLSRAGLPVVNVSGPYSSLNNRLNRYAGALVCNMQGHVPFGSPRFLGRPARLFNRVYPRFASISPGIEPMAKTFEVAGAGCAPIIDAIDELSELGFISGRTCLIYSDFGEAEEIIRTSDDARLREIGAAAEQLARSRHTWSHRARRFASIVNDCLCGKA